MWHIQLSKQRALKSFALCKMQPAANSALQNKTKIISILCNHFVCVVVRCLCVCVRHIVNINNIVLHTSCSAMLLPLFCIAATSTAVALAILLPLCTHRQFVTCRTILLAFCLLHSTRIACGAGVTLSGATTITTAVLNTERILSKQVKEWTKAKGEQ